MSLPPSEQRVWEEHMERWRRFSRRAAMHPGAERSSPDPGEARRALASEWAAAPLGRLGRCLLADIEPYLEFFAIARQEPGSGWAGPATTQRGGVR
jgi:hypothetical protein